MNSKRLYIRTSIVMIYFIFFLSGCINPFAPKLDEDNISDGNFLNSQKKIDGVFNNFQYAYSFKDTTIYGKLLSEDFTFSYRDYDRGIDYSWGRDDEMRVSYGLFSNSERLDLVWNNIISVTEDSTNIVRSFNLTVTFNPSDIIYVDGRVNLTLRKNSEDDWLITRWIDESNY